MRTALRRRHDEPTFAALVVIVALFYGTVGGLAACAGRWFVR